MASNWKLSTARATELVRLLIVRYRLSPQRLAAAGYAQYHPVASNATPTGRAQNRRVDVVILNEKVTPGGSAASRTTNGTTTIGAAAKSVPAPNLTTGPSLSKPSAAQP